MPLSLRIFPSASTKFLPSLLLPIAVALIVILVQRVRLPVFLAIIATTVVYGIAADMTFQSVGKAFGIGFSTALEQTGLLVVPGVLVGAVLLRTPLGTGTSAALGVVGGLGATASGSLALLQPAGQDAPRRALGLALGLLAVASLVPPSPLAVAAISVMKTTVRAELIVAVPVPPFVRFATRTATAPAGTMAPTRCLARHRRTS